MSENDKVTAQALQKLGECHGNERLKRKAFRRLRKTDRRCRRNVLGQTVPGKSCSNRKGPVANGGQPCTPVVSLQMISEWGAHLNMRREGIPYFSFFFSFLCSLHILLHSAPLLFSLSFPLSQHALLFVVNFVLCPWRRPPGCPRIIWLRTVDEDVQSLNFGVHTAWRKAKDRDVCRQVISTATLWEEFATKKKKKPL